MGSNLGCINHTFQLILFLLNFVIWALGLAIVILGLWAYLTGDALPYIEIVNGADDLWSHAMLTFIIIGFIMFFMGYLGCHGAAHENSLMLHIYVILLMAVVVVQLVVIILGIIFYDEIEGKLLEVMKDQIRNEYQYEQTGVGIDGAWNKLMTENNCCGAEDYMDFRDSLFYNTTGGEDGLTVPYTCCNGTKPDGENFAPPPFDDRMECYRESREQDSPFEFLFERGCFTQLLDWIETRAIFLIACGCCFLAIQILLIVMTCCILQKMKDN